MATTALRIELEGDVLRTVGLRAIGQSDLRLRLPDDPELGQHAEALLRNVFVYLARNPGVKLTDAQTYGYGYWHVRFREEDGSLAICELVPDASEYVRGAGYTLWCWKEQHAACERCESPFSPPAPESLAAISAGVMDGEAAQGVRYPSPEHMSGWWISTQRYEEDREMTNDHMHHLTRARPDLVPYLALAHGFRFNFEAGDQRIWFDQSVAEQEPE